MSCTKKQKIKKINIEESCEIHLTKISIVLKWSSFETESTLQLNVLLLKPVHLFPWTQRALIMRFLSYIFIFSQWPNSIWSNEVSADLQYSVDYTNTSYHLDLSSFSQIHCIKEKCMLTLQNIKTWNLCNVTLVQLVMQSLSNFHTLTFRYLSINFL